MMGTPSPKDPPNNPVEWDADLILGAFLSGGIAPGPYASWRRDPIVDLRFRGLTVQNIEALELAISKALIDRRDFMLASLYLVECEQVTALQRLGSDEQGYEFVTSYVFTAYRP
jgi:hypothetical protein